MLLLTQRIVILLLGSIFLLTANATKIPWVAFNGGGSRSGTNTDETVISPTSVSGLSLLWSRKLTDPDLTWVYGTETIDSSPLFLPSVSLPSGEIVDLLFFNSLMGTLYAVNADTGATVWQNTVMIECETNDCITKHTPVLDPNLAFIYCYRVDGTVRKYAVATGEEITGTGFPVFMTYIPVYEQGSASANIIDGWLYMTISGDNNDHKW
jgi:outer membrane protein assembly factor BamB